MKVIILAGGFGTRISEKTQKVPKPMVKVGDKPIVWHIMNHYDHFGYDDFLLALGYKSEVIKDYFLNYYKINSNFKIELSSGEIEFFKTNHKNWKVSLIDTGLKTMTGGRLKRLKSYIGNNKNFLLTYGDGLSDININELVDFHKSHGKLVTISSVRPSARFGELSINKNLEVTSFKEKPQTEEGWVNGGFFVIKKEFIDFILDDNTILENEPLERAAEIGQLMAFKHKGFWQCMDTKRDKELLENLYLNNPPWIN